MKELRDKVFIDVEKALGITNQELSGLIEYIIAEGTCVKYHGSRKIVDIYSINIIGLDIKMIAEQMSYTASTTYFGIETESWCILADYVKNAHIPTDKYLPDRIVYASISQDSDFDTYEKDMSIIRMMF